MRAPGVLYGQSVDLGRAGPALRGAQDQHRPQRGALDRSLRRLLLDRSDLVHDGVEYRHHPFVHSHRVFAIKTAGDDMGGVAISAHQVE